MIRKYGYLKNFINELRSNGKYAFSLPEVWNKFQQSDETIKNNKALQRLTKKGEIISVKAFFLHPYLYLN